MRALPPSCKSAGTAKWSSAPHSAIYGQGLGGSGQIVPQSESLVTLGRTDCGPVYRRGMAGDGLAYAYVNATNVFYFSPIE